MLIRPASSINGTITLPGDKSISHRAAMIAAMAVGETRIDNFAPGEDCESTLECLRDLGVNIRRDSDTVFIVGVGKKGFSRPSQTLDCGNSGTTMRLLAGILAGQDFESTLTGDESLLRRPMQRVIEPVALMGAEIASDNGRPPIKVSGGNLHAIEYSLPVASAQIKSCVLLAGLNAEGKTTVVERERTRDHTERMLEWFGGTVEHDNSRISISGNTELTARDFVIPGDISSAAFFLVAAAALGGSELVLRNVGVNPTRSGLLEILKDCGVDVVVREAADRCNEPIATLSIAGGLADLPSSRRVLRGEQIANVIDEIPILAVLGTHLESGIEIRDAGELRNKESDRITAIVENLTRMGARVEEFSDGFRVERSRLNDSRINSFGDHRIAMAFAVAALFADGDTEIENAECVAVSYPAFFESLAAVVR